VAKKALEGGGYGARLALEGVPNETRRPLPDGNSQQLMRAASGKEQDVSARPDVLPHSRHATERLAVVTASLPELPAESGCARLADTYGIPVKRH
jgi:Glu-tRNA(Gln) amidotransferase subunit E-like FAD-binding protein